MKNEHRVSMVKLAHQVAGIAPKEPEAEVPMASIRLEFIGGDTLVAKHGDTGEVLMRREVPPDFWMRQLWPLIEGRAE